MRRACVCVCVCAYRDVLTLRKKDEIASSNTGEPPVPTPSCSIAAACSRKARSWQMYGTKNHVS
jgi:hypothetical protein